MSRLSGAQQIELLERSSVSFASSIQKPYLVAAPEVKILQINVGKWCNQACRHCHVDASPARTERMDDATARRCLAIAQDLPNLEVIDLTGGAPEGHEVFPLLIEGARSLDKRVIDRCNLTILSEPGYEHIPAYLAEHRVEVVASLPHFSAQRTDHQRGKGVFDRSLAGLKKLNELGYGTALPLHLVYNPSGAFLAGDQTSLEKEFKHKLLNQFGITFTGLYALNNLPISRFLESLVRANQFKEYMEVLAQAFNPKTLPGLMCRHQINVGFDGFIYDCDFNQMLDLPVENRMDIWNFDLTTYLNRKIRIHNHCYGCTAGAGSSCGGSIE